MNVSYKVSDPRRLQYIFGGGEGRGQGEECRLYQVCLTHGSVIPGVKLRTVSEESRLPIPVWEKSMEKRW